MEILKIIARLMDYPRQEVSEYKADLALLIGRTSELPPDSRAQLLETLESIYSSELLDAEEQYTGLFEQGRSLSLHIFEHVHGESRDRGQAMVDLMEEYSRNGFEINCHELPDYIPLFLEYLSTRNSIEAREWLADVSHILALLAARLLERGSCYAHLFEALLIIAGRSEQLSESKAKVANEEPDYTAEAIDKEWEEIAVTFDGTDKPCQSPATATPADSPQPVRWVDPASPNTQNTGVQ